MGESFFKDEVFAIVGAAIAVHSELGFGFLEAIYQEAMEIELTERNIPFVVQSLLEVRYKKRLLSKKYVADLVCYNSIIVEIKSVARLCGHEHAQVRNYLKATGLRVALLINFGSSGKLEWKRLIH
ncbi:MAG: GxxExxY protein [Peptococcaceae bacterium]|nr:GxxExxY protein [Peptococcaceae bacterium]